MSAVAIPSRPPPFTADCHWFGAGTSVAFGGELDVATAPAAEAALRRAEHGPGLVVLDLRALSFMDCTGLRIVMAADARAHDAGGRLVVVHGPRPVRRVFELTGTDARLELVGGPVLDVARAQRGARPAGRRLVSRRRPRRPGGPSGESRRRDR